MKKTMVKILSAVMAVVLMLGLTGCGSVNFKKAKWNKYDEMPFMEYLEQSVNNMAEEQQENVKINVSYEEGWDESDELDEGDVSKGNKAVTYIVSMDFEDEEVNNYFFMEYVKEDKALKVKGALNVEDDDWREEVSAGEAREILRELEEYID